ncbi:Uncharacterised protein [Mycobacteroides abscessus subsp. abscessus]|nr:Uncharacterised protein [Mycobacteroides abscessus subsp. abscessus]
MSMPGMDGIDDAGCGASAADPVHCPGSTRPSMTAYIHAIASIITA